MIGAEVWDSLIAEGIDRPIELQTKTGRHFKLVSDGKTLTVNESTITPSSKLKSPRRITKDNFIKVFPYYEKWATSEKGSSAEITAVTMNSVYIMAAIRYKINC